MSKRRKRKSGRKQAAPTSAPAPQASPATQPPAPQELPVIDMPTKANPSRGRNTYCSADLAHEVANAIAVVGFLRPACERAGVPYRTARDWIQHGEEELQRIYGGKAPNEDRAAFAYFASCVSQARGNLQYDMANQIKRMSMPHAPIIKDGEGNLLSHGDANLALSFLKSAFPDTWGQRVLNANLTAEVEPLPVDVSKFSDEDLKVLSDMAARAIVVADEDE